MPSPDKKRFYQDVYNIVSQIPSGKVLTYGRIALLAGWPQHARMVGRALRDVLDNLHLPCHRVVNSNGRTAPGWQEQSGLLKAEGVVFKQAGKAESSHVDLTSCLWQIEE